MTRAASASASSARVVAQAKVNLFLRVLAREASGYHQLETLFQRIELGDEVRVRVGGAAQALDCRGADVGPVERNLAWRAAQAYLARAGWPRGFAIEIDKRIPVGGGLGGGSADAGAVLRCLDALAPAPLGPDVLLELAGGLGSDVPFLAATAPRALAWGRGERMLALPPLEPRPVLLALADEGVSTPAAFGWLAESRGGHGPEPRLLASDAVASWDAVARLAENDFERAVFPRHAAAARVHAELRASGHPIVLLSGSGATVFAVLAAGAAPEAGPPGRGVRFVGTRTAARVAPVELGG
jgi:4-diphosphocytidyl-2-C-methyl-D-erythritol kinase